MAGMSGSTPYAVIGTKPFSRRRHYDMDERKQRILGDPKYVIAVDKEALDKQVKEEIEHRLGQEKAREQYEQWDLARIAAMKQAEDIQKREKKISDMEIERFWQLQQKCKVQRDVEEKMFLLSMNEKIGPFDKDRYLEQDLEPQRNASIMISVNHERLWQETMANQKREKESKARIDWIHQEIDNRHRMRLYEENVAWQQLKRQIFERDKKIEREQLKMCQAKEKEAKQEHKENHMYQIQPEYFSQFQTTSR